ncbi:MAG: LPP20 family lipoprotein, partial [Bacteroidota bacterium]
MLKINTQYLNIFKRTLKGKKLFFWLSIVGCFACTPQVGITQKRNKKNKQAQVVADNRPSWVKAKPVESGYYTGIGYASSQMSDYQQAAKKSALQDLLSEIKVTVSSRSFLFQTDKNDQFREAYESSIKTTTSGEVQDFELVDTYEDEQQKGYWVYYRLSKAKYQSEKLRKQENAKKQALDFYEKAQQNAQKGDWMTAMDLYMKGLMSLKDYWGENTSVVHEGQEIQLGATLYTKVQRILDQLVVTSPTTKIALSKRMNTSAEVTVQVQDRTQRSLANMPLSTTFLVGGGDVHPYYTTNAQGKATIIVGKVYGNSASQKLQIGIALEKISQGSVEDPFYNYLLSRFRVPTHEVILSIEKPVFYLTSTEKNLGESLDQTALRDQLKAALANNGVEFTEDKSKAEVWLEL